MIRFRTIDPAEQARADEKAAAAKPAVAPPAQPEPTADGQDPEDAAIDGATPKAKGLARKTPLRAKKPETSGLFRD
ncbi:MAG: hypothetical protein B7Z40_20800 [Bosea sp. 12-68-7]|nr:MAG: hypothetical protein B7Z40_20800 [Bosea sp. 12-68-7]